MVAASWGGGLCYTSGYERRRWRFPPTGIPCGRRSSAGDRQRIDRSIETSDCLHNSPNPVKIKPTHNLATHSSIVSPKRQTPPPPLSRHCDERGSDDAIETTEKE
jgi:hypothetical protein